MTHTEYEDAHCGALVSLRKATREVGNVKLHDMRHGLLLRKDRGSLYVLWPSLQRITVAYFEAVSLDQNVPDDYPWLNVEDGD